jgi:hypothetical protein
MTLSPISTKKRYTAAATAPLPNRQLDLATFILGTDDQLGNSRDDYW